MLLVGEESTLESKVSAFRPCLRLGSCHRSSQILELILDFEQDRQCAACADWDSILPAQVSECQDGRRSPILDWPLVFPPSSFDTDGRLHRRHLAPACTCAAGASACDACDPGEFSNASGADRPLERVLDAHEELTLALTLRSDIVHCVPCWALLQRIRLPVFPESASHRSSNESRSM